MSSQPPNRRRSSILAVVGLVCLLLVGCATVPTSGPVEKHRFGGEPASSTVLVAPVPPAPGATQMLVVEGFLHAMGTDQGDFSIARQYLTETAAKEWDPAAGTTVYADGAPPRETDSSVVLTAPVLGTLNTRGEFREGVGRIVQDFQLVKDADDQWRISRPPDGLLISRYDLANNYIDLDLHFLDVTGTALVPDPRYFPLNSSTLLTIVKAQLASPGWWLAPAVRPVLSGVIDVEDVTLTSLGVAEVHLTPHAFALSDEQTRALLAELTWTLTQSKLPEVTGIRVFAGATTLSLNGSPESVLTDDSFSFVAPVDGQAGSLFAAIGGRVLDVDTAVTWSRAAAVAPSLTEVGALAVRADQLQLAAVNPEGTRLSTATLTGTEPPVTVLEGTKLLRPAYSRQQELWVIGEGAGATGFQVFSGLANAPVAFAADSLPEGSVAAFRISPDGARMALVIRGPESDQVGIARIVRSGEGVRLQQFRPVTLGTPPELGMRLLDVGWSTGTELLVMVQHAGTEKYVSVLRVTQDSLTVDEMGPSQQSGLNELTVVPEHQPLVSSDQVTLRGEGDFNWKVAATSVKAVAYSG